MVNVWSPPCPCAPTHTPQHRSLTKAPVAQQYQLRRRKNLHGLTGQPVLPPPPPGQGSPTPLMKWVASPSESKMRCGRSRARNVVTVPSSLCHTPTQAQIYPFILCARRVCACAPLLSRGVGDDGRDIPVPAVRGEGVAAHGRAEGLVVHAVADGVVAWLAAVGVHPTQHQSGQVKSGAWLWELSICALAMRSPRELLLINESAALQRGRVG